MATHKPRYSAKRTILDGEGAREGGRWNKAGLPLVYASENSALAILENLAHVRERYLPPSLVAVPITIPDDAPVKSISARDLPSTWRDIDNAECVNIGSSWIEARTGLVLRVPSAANSLEENILLNPLHRDISRCDVGEPVPVVFDLRSIALVQ